jgi:hypothetical protein
VIVLAVVSGVEDVGNLELLQVQLRGGVVYGTKVEKRADL